MTASHDLLWWQEGVIYQIYPRSFKDTTGNGVGDLGGILEKLDYLADTLGVQALWLSPFYPSPMADFGYDVSNYTDVHPMFGDLTMFDRLVHGVHAKGMKLIVDFVPNHSSDQHAWFQESRISRDNPKRDWYVWHDPKPDGSPPNNWLSVFGGPAWTLDEATGQYYLHSFLKEQPDLNWRNPEVKAAMLDAMAFWLERGVDGFRIDVAHFIMKDPEMRDNPPNTERGEYHKDMGAYDSQVHLYDKGHADVHTVFGEIRDLLDRYSTPEQPRYSVGEIHIFDWDEWATYYGDDDELHMPFNFALLQAGYNARAIRAVVDGLEGAIPAHGWPNYVLGNHDEQRAASRFGAQGARVAAMLLLTLRGTPTLYYGDEIGMPEADVPVELQQDPWGLRVPGLSRDGCRTPMQWDASRNAGFSDADTTWLPVQNNYPTRNVEAQLQDESSMLTLHRALLTLRSHSKALHGGAYEPVDGVPESCYVYHRTAENERILVALNLSDETHGIALGNTGDILLSTYLDRTQETLAETLTLRPNEGVIVELTS